MYICVGVMLNTKDAVPSLKKYDNCVFQIVVPLKGNVAISKMTETVFYDLIKRLADYGNLSQIVKKCIYFRISLFFVNTRSVSI